MPFSERTMLAIDELCDASSLVEHPLIAAWGEGTLNRDELRAFATQYYHHIEAFPRYVSTVHSITPDALTRRALLEVLWSAESRTPTAADLWLQTCAALGLFSDSVRSAQCTPTTEACTNDFFYLCQSSTVSGLAALYAWSRQLPATCKVQCEALKQEYGMNSGPGLEFFEVCGYSGAAHAQSLRVALKHSICNAESAREATGAADAAMTALRGMFSGAIPAAVR